MSQVVIVLRVRIPQRRRLLDKSLQPPGGSMRKCCHHLRHIIVEVTETLTSTSLSYLHLERPNEAGR